MNFLGLFYNGLLQKAYLGTRGMFSIHPNDIFIKIIYYKHEICGYSHLHYFYFQISSWFKTLDICLILDVENVFYIDYILTYLQQYTPINSLLLSLEFE